MQTRHRRKNSVPICTDGVNVAKTEMHDRVAWLVWHFSAGLAAGLIPSQLRVGLPLTALPADEFGLAARIVLVHWVIAVLLLPRTHVSGSRRWVGVALVFGASHGVLALSLLLTESFSSRTILGGGVGLSGLLLVLALWLRARSLIFGGIAVLVSVAALQATGGRPTHWWKLAFDLYPKPRASLTTLGTQLYELNLLSFHNYFDVCPQGRPPCRPPGNGGGLARLGEGYLLATGEGELYYIEVDETERRLRKQRLVISVPINQATYVAAVGENVYNTFRVTDLKVSESSGEIELLAVHHFWKVEESCGVLRLSSWRGSKNLLFASQVALPWRTVYETSPCLPATKGSLTRSSESGGRLEFVGDDTLLLTVGDHEYDGLNRVPIAAQDPTYAYGKTLLIDRQSGSARIYTSGHRNPQGLFIDGEGTIWSTEHGPQGGDEINILREGRNYGWPIVTYGVQYGMRVWPLNPQQGLHQGYEPPVFAFVPSIAISQLVRIEGGMFPLWRGDLLVASYKKALYRLRLEQGRVVYVEPIPINGRIRHLLQEDDGKIVLYLDSGALLFITAAGRDDAVSMDAPVATISSPVTRGRQLFASCMGCHAKADGTQHGIGPDLANVFGRRIAGAQGFAYSSALRARQGAWDEANLDAFIADPQAFASGTSMAFAGISDAADRAALIAYLREPGN